MEQVGNNNRRRRLVSNGLLGMVSAEAEPGRPVKRPTSGLPCEEIPGAQLSPERSIELQTKLREINRLEHFVEPDL